MTDIIQQANKTDQTFEEKVEKLENSFTTISLSQIEQEASELDRQETYVVNGVTNEVIKYYPIFDQTKIDALLKELQEKIKYSEEKKIDFFKDDENLYNYLYFLVIKYFTHFSDEIADDLETQIVQMDAMVRLGYYQLILDEVFAPEQLIRVLDKFNRLINLSEKLTSIQLDAQLKAEELAQKTKAIQQSVKTKPKEKPKTIKKKVVRKK